MDMRCAHKVKLEPRCGVQSNVTKTERDKLRELARTFTSRVNVHVRCNEGALGLGGHVVIGVVRLHHAYAIPSVEFFPFGSCSSC